MDRQELKREIIRMYANCCAYIMIEDAKEKARVLTTKFRHPRCRKIIEVSETANDVKCVLVYNDTTNAMQRNAVECKTIEDFRKAIA